MPAARSTSDAAVLRATGTSRATWDRRLDAARRRLEAAAGRADGPPERLHTALARHLRTRFHVAPWWSQELTVLYERARGLRAVNQRADRTFEVNVSRTIPLPRARAFRAFTDATSVSTWFTTKATQDVRVGGAYRNADGDRGTYLAITPPRRLRFTWDNPEHAPGSVVEVTFTPKDRGRTTVRVTHGRLADRRAVEGMRVGWTWALASLATFAATGRGLPYATWDARRQATRTRRPSRRRRAP